MAILDVLAAEVRPGLGEAMAILDNPWVQEEKHKEGLGAMPIFPRGGSRIKIVPSFFGIRRGLAEEHVYCL